MSKDLITNEIQLLSWDSIEEIFGSSKKDMEKTLEKANYSANFWYPHSQNGADEADVKSIVSIFEYKFPDVSIQSRHDYRYTEIFLNTLDKHQLAFTLANLFL